MSKFVAQEIKAHFYELLIMGWMCSERERRHDVRGIVGRLVFDQSHVFQINDELKAFVSNYYSDWQELDLISVLVKQLLEEVDWNFIYRELLKQFTSNEPSVSQSSTLQSD